MKCNLAVLNGAGDKDGGPEYDLYAVINHTGTMAGGHYVATCRAPGTCHTQGSNISTRFQQQTPFSLEGAEGWIGLHANCVAGAVVSMPVCAGFCKLIPTPSTKS